MLKQYQKRPSVLMNLIAIGSLWNATEGVSEEGKQLWLYTVRTVLSRGAHLSQNNASAIELWSLLYAGHSYVLMSDDHVVQHLGRRAWISSFPMLQDKVTIIRPTLPNPDHFLAVDTDERQKAWENWRRDEEKVRVTMGLYAYDSQQSLCMFQSPSSLSALKRTQLPLPDELLDAPTAESWMHAFARFSSTSDTHNPPCFGPLLTVLHKDGSANDTPCEKLNKMAWTNSLLSAQTLLTLLEAIYIAWRLETDHNGKTSNFVDSVYPNNAARGPWCRTFTALANWANLRRYCMDRTSRTRTDFFFLTERWHNIQLNIDFPTSLTVSVLRKLSGREERKDSDFIPYENCDKLESKDSLEAFYRFAGSSRRARKALYHSGAVFSRFLRMQRGDSYPSHVVQALVEAALFIGLCCIALRKSAPVTPYFELVAPQDSDVIQMPCCCQEDEACPLVSVQQPLYSGRMEASTWIKYGDIRQACFEHLPLFKEGHMVLQLMLNTLSSSRLNWCFACDSILLLRSCLNLLEN